MNELSDQELLDALGVSVEPEKKRQLTAREERIIAGFEEIQRFVQEQGRLPSSRYGADIFERLYATRLQAIRQSEECRALVQQLDFQALLDAAPDSPPEIPEGDDEALLTQLGVSWTSGDSDVTQLKHVRSVSEKRVAEEIGNRDVCEDFSSFSPLFERIQNELDQGIRKTIRFEQKAEIQKGSFFIAGGQKAYVAEKGDSFLNEYGHTDARLRVIYENGTENNLLMRSFQRALRQDKTGRRITVPTNGPLFGDEPPEEILASGTIYVLRTKSDEPLLVPHREVLHKIGVTGGKVERRLTNAKSDPTFLLADVEIVARYKVYNINHVKLENLIHKILEPARCPLVLQDRFGKPFRPREWFIVPLSVIDEIVERIRDGSITDYRFDKEQARLVKA